MLFVFSRKGLQLRMEPAKVRNGKNDTKDRGEYMSGKAKQMAKKLVYSFLPKH